MEDIHRWDPLSVDEVTGLLSPVRFPWWIAGGWAIDLFLGRQTRSHDDTDVLVLRDDQLELQEYLTDRGWDLHKTQQPGLKPWPPGEFQNRPVNDIWCRRAPHLPWALQIMLLDTDGGRWVFRRDPSIGGPIESLGLRTSTGVPYLRPEIQLLYYAKLDSPAKNQADFDHAVPELSGEARVWLLGCLEKMFPQGHVWIPNLRREMAQPRGPGDA
jgi:hypothetical protein